MKKILLVLAFMLANIFFLQTNAASDPNTDYTYIDCVNGSDLRGEPFNRTSPYLTLKAWVENTVNYINQQWLTNTTGSGADFTSKNFNIFIRSGCLFNGKNGANIEVNFNGDTNNSTLTIAWLWGLVIIDNMYFHFPGTWNGNVVFRNFNFWKNNVYWYYFSNLESHWSQKPNSPLISIKDSIINLNQNQIVRDNWCYPSWYYGYTCYIAWVSVWWYKLENNKIDITVNGDYGLKVPVFVKNNKITFSNTTTQKYNVYFYVAWYNGNGYNYASLNMFSNEIDLNGNNFFTDNNNATYINNKFVNVGTFTAWTDTTNYKLNNFINNQIQSSNQVNISTNGSAYNNHFVNGFIDTVDTQNTKRNFQNISDADKGIWWVYKKEISSKITFSTDYRKLYKEVTGTTLEIPTNPVQVLIY